MTVTFLTTEDSQAIFNQLAETRAIMNEVGKDIGHMMQMRTEMELSLTAIQKLHSTLIKEIKYYRSKEYHREIIETFKDELIQKVVNK